MSHPSQSTKQENPATARSKKTFEKPMASSQLLSTQHPKCCMMLTPLLSIVVVFDNMKSRGSALTNPKGTINM